MLPDLSTVRRYGRRLAPVGLAATFVAVNAYPHLLRLRHPSIYWDDVVRLAQLRSEPLGALLFRPYNEHMAPLFEIVTWAALALTGRSLSEIPVVFAVASFVPLILAMILLGWVVRRESGSSTTAWVAAAAFGLAAHDSEVVFWFSASSFNWALAATMAAWLAAAGATEDGEGRRARGLIGAAVWALIAPAFSAIGLLAGPLAALRLLSSGSGRGLRAGALAPMSGTLAYLAICEVFRYRQVLADGLRQNVGLATALWNIGRAPVDVLVPGLIGVRNIDRFLPDAVELALSAAAALGLLAWAWRSPRWRPLALGGLAMIGGGYAVTYGVRSTTDARNLLDIQRYHLFPHAGLVLLLAPAARAWLSRFDGRPVASLTVASALSLAFLAVHLDQIKQNKWYSRFDGQTQTFAALERLDALCREHRITRSQVLTHFDPIHPRWVHPDSNALELLPDSVEAPGLADALVRPTLLAALKPEEREALCANLDATLLRLPVDRSPGHSAPIEAHLVATCSVHTAGMDGSYVTGNWPSYLEYRLGPEADEARALCLPGDAAGRRWEIEWADATGDWSPNRSVWWRPGPTAPGRDWAIPLDRLPHWRSGHVRRLRVIFHEKGPVAVGQPRLLR